jgi:hypothetical protein
VLAVPERLRAVRERKVEREVDLVRLARSVPDAGDTLPDMLSAVVELIQERPHRVQGAHVQDEVDVLVLEDLRLDLGVHAPHHDPAALVARFDRVGVLLHDADVVDVPGEPDHVRCVASQQLRQRITLDEHVEDGDLVPVLLEIRGYVLELEGLADHERLQADRLTLGPGADE